MDKWTRYYSGSPDAPPPWCSGKPSTHLARFLKTGSVAPANATAKASSPPSSPPPLLRRRGGGGDALDLGCGSNGTNVALLASAGYRAAGVDLVPEAVARARKGAAAWLEGPSAPSEVLPQPPIAFAGADLLDESTQLSSWEDVRRMEVEQLGQGEQATTMGAGDGGDGRRRQRGFSLLFDCQTFHVLRTVVDEELVVARYRSLLAPGGALVLLCGRPAQDDGGGARAQRSDGPNEVSLAELRAAFSPASGWVEREIVATRFDPTPAYDRLPDGPPLAWAVVAVAG